ncbi:FkbM family methyltransferase [Bradyrhizobium sp. LLZ17]|uniref:FkbM family methyltransferase n=1 Tax=Bradyrhizobium sp. LLZ17 TaxID=3239388 RepID=A0AB39XVA5_9BRAD
MGVNDGADSAYYLSLGYRVLGIEANPALADRLKDRFARELLGQQYILLNAGIAATEGQLDFWVSDVSEWSSFNREIASRNGTPHRPVTIPTRRFASVVAEFGVPLYCKIDIEGNDRLCLTDLTLETTPSYVSIEMSHPDADDDLELLRKLGYTRYKIVSQVTRAQPIPLLMTMGYRLPTFFNRALRYSTRKAFGVGTKDGWRFQLGSSGPFGEDTPGSWHPYDHVRRTWEALRDIDARFGTRGLAEWFDIHAAR